MTNLTIATFYLCMFIVCSFIFVTEEVYQQKKAKKLNIKRERFSDDYVREVIWALFWPISLSFLAIYLFGNICFYASNKIADYFVEKFN